MRVITAILAVFLTAASLAAGTIPFDPFQGLVEVEVTIDGRAKGRFGIDTGADELYINREFAEKHGLKMKQGPRRGVVGIEGHSEASALPIRSIEVGDERLYNLEATAIDLRALIKDERAEVPDGLIGYDVLRRFYVTVDYPNQTMSLQQEEPSWLGDGSYATIPFEIEHHLIMVDVTFNADSEDPVTVPMALDYCASYMFLTPELAGRIGVDPEAGRVELHDVTVGGEITTGKVYAGIGDLGGLKQRLFRVEFEGLIGASFLYPHKVTIDYKRERMYLHE